MNHQISRRIRLNIRGMRMQEGWKKEWEAAQHKEILAERDSLSMTLDWRSKTKSSIPPSAFVLSRALNAFHGILSCRLCNLWTIQILAGLCHWQRTLAHGMNKCTPCIYPLQLSAGPMFNPAERPRKTEGQGTPRNSCPSNLITYFPPFWYPI